MDFLQSEPNQQEPTVNAESQESMTIQHHMDSTAMEKNSEDHSIIKVSSVRTRAKGFDDPKNPQDF